MEICRRRTTKFTFIGQFFLRNGNSAGEPDTSFYLGNVGDVGIAGDWDGNGTDTIGVYRNGRFLLRNSNTLGFADIAFYLGNPGDMPDAGDWDG